MKRFIAIFVWAFASGIPLLLITTTLSAHLFQAGLALEKIGLIIVAIVPYALKFLLAPIVERYSIPILNHYVGRVRSWMIIAMLAMMFCLIWLGTINLQNTTSHYELFIAVFSVALFSATNDIAEAELRINILQKSELAAGSAFYIVGYGLGELVAGSVTLILAGLCGWKTAYFLTAILILLGIIAAALKKQHTERVLPKNRIVSQTNHLILRPFYYLQEKIIMHFISPMKPVLLIKGWQWLVLIIFFYYAGSYMTVMMINPFYMKLGLSVEQIGILRAAIGVCILIVGGFFAGRLCKKLGILKILLICAFLYMGNFLLQGFISQLVLHHIISLYDKITWILFAFSMFFSLLIDVISVVSYITLIASLCQPPFVATQNAFLTSTMVLSKIVFSSVGGFLVVYVGWENFFVLLSISFIPAIFFIYRAYKTQSTLISKPQEALPTLI